MSKVFSLILLPDRLTICRLPPDALLPSWAESDGLQAIIRTTDELCIICGEDNVPANITAEPNWRALKVRGPLVFSEVGVIASLANPLAEAGISIFVISTFETDYILVKKRDLEAAVENLREAGHSVRIDGA
jgi:hypothetical protein